MNMNILVVLGITLIAISLFLLHFANSLVWKILDKKPTLENNKIFFAFWKFCDNKWHLPGLYGILLFLLWFIVNINHLKG